MNISIIRDSIEIGEWTEEEVREFYREGRLVDTDRYWTEGMIEWTPLSRLIRPAPPFPASTTPDLPMEPPPFHPASQKTKKTDTQKFNIPEAISEGEVEAEQAAEPPPFWLPPLSNTPLPPLPSWPVALPPLPTQHTFHNNPVLKSKAQRMTDALGSGVNFLAQNFALSALALLMLVGFTLSFFVDNSGQSNQGLPPQRQDPAAQELSQSKASFNQPALPLPQNGDETPSYTTEALAPLTIQTPAGDTNYFIKVVDAHNPNQVITTFFMRGGMTYKTRVPLGSYLIKYATGKTWYGYQYLFGPNTTYNMADDTFNFTETADGYDGHIIQLILQQNGNLNQKPISPQEW